jgi:Xaa-Pro aminopeptidase
MSETATAHHLPIDLIQATAARRERLLGVLAERGIDALLVGFPTDIRYLTGFVGDDTLILVSGEATRIVTDSRFDEELDPWRDVPGVEVVMATRHRLEETIRSIAGREGLNRIGIQAEQTTITRRSTLADALGEETLVETVGIIPTLRMRKDEAEIAAIERALAIQTDGLRAALEHLTIGMTEVQFAAHLEYEMRTRGASGPSFGTIIAAGANSSVMHYQAGDVTIEEGALLIDWGALVDGYCGDLTRTFGVGTMPPKIREIYPIVLEAQLAAIDACAPGKFCAAIDKVARDIITKAGYGEAFAHGLGHSLGIEVHESPYFNDLETATMLEPGMVMTVEPGMYLPGIGGVRIEDDVVITDSGCRVLSDYPKDLDSAILQPRTAAVG